MIKLEEKGEVMVEYFNLKGKSYSYEELKEVIMKAAKRSGLDNYYNFKDDEIVFITSEKVSFMKNNFFIKSYKVSGAITYYQIKKGLNISNIISSFTRDLDQAYIFLKLLSDFVSTLLLELNVDSAADIEDSIDGELLKLELYYELKKEFYSTEYNIWFSSMYIPEYDGLNVNVRTDDFEEDEETEILFKGNSIYVYGNTKKVRLYLQSGEFIGFIKALLVQSVIMRNGGTPISFNLIEKMIEDDERSNKNTIYDTTELYELISVDFKNYFGDEIDDAFPRIKIVYPNDYDCVIYKYKEFYFSYFIYNRKFLVNEKETELVKEISRLYYQMDKKIK